MSRTELPALETTYAQLDPGRFGFMVFDFENTHGTEINTNSTSVTKNTINIYLH
jgi:hypothetical protein